MMALIEKYELHFSIFHYIYESNGSCYSAAYGGGVGFVGLSTNGTFIDQNADRRLRAEQPEWADSGNASTNRLKGCVSEAQERFNKSSILP